MAGMPSPTTRPTLESFQTPVTSPLGRARAGRNDGLSDGALYGRRFSKKNREAIKHELGNH